jgi:hypothetical protein
MKRIWPLTGFVLTLACAFAVHGQDFSRMAGETDPAFAKRVLRLSAEAEPHVTTANWNGAPTQFVDYETTGEYPERPLVALQQEATGAYRVIEVTLGEQEGGTPDVLALGFANADHDPAKELIVILAWSQMHYDFEGTLYEVRIFDDAKPRQKALTLLKVSQKFESGCDCGWRDGTSKRYRFKTITAVRAELKRLGY